MKIDDMYGKQLTEEELTEFVLDMRKRHIDKIKEEVRKFYPKAYKTITKWSERV